MNGENTPAPDATESTRGSRMALLVLLGLGTLVTAMGSSAVFLALPIIREEFGVDIQQGSWIFVAPLTCATTLLLIMGRAGDLFGYHRIYYAGFSIFTLGSAACGAAPTNSLLIAARVLQAVGMAMILTSGPAIISSVFPASELGMALGLTSTAVYVGLFLGPPIGGSLVTAFGWRWVFYGIVPLSLAVLLASLKLVPRRPPVAAAPFDLMGMILLIAGLPLFVMALNQSRVWGFTSPQTIFCFAAGTVLLAAFVFHELRTEHPLLDMSLFRSRLFSGAALAAVANYMALNCTNFLIPFYFSEAAGISAGLAGAYMASQPMMMAAIAWPFGWLSDRIGSRLLTVLGMAIMTVAIAGLALASSPSSHPAITAVWLGLMGLGTGIFISPNSSALLGSAPRNRQGIASGVLAFARNLGMIFGISSAANIFASLGGVAGGDWPQTDQGAFRAALLVAAAVSLAGALTSSMRGSDRRR